jgi:hypothetical protein
VGQTSGMTGNGVFTVLEIPSARWEIAMDQLEHGRGYVVLEGDVDVALRRWPTGPRPDPRLNVAIYATSEPRKTPSTVATREVGLGLAAYRSAIGADSRLAALIEQHGQVIEYLYDYGMGAVLVGTVSDDDSLVWEPTFEPGPS